MKAKLDQKHIPTGDPESESQGGTIDILVGMDHMNEAPREHKRRPGLILYKSVCLERDTWSAEHGAPEKQTQA